MILISIGRLDLGNNYQYQHFIDALDDDQVTRIRQKPWELDSDIRIIAKGNLGKVTLNTCGSDLADHLRGL